MNVRLISFAVHWIKAEMQEFILRNWRIVKVATTKAKRKLFFNLRKIKKHLGWSSQKEIRLVAQDLGVPPTTVQEMEAHLTSSDISLDDYLNESHQDEHTKTAHVPVAAYSDGRYNPERLLENKNLYLLDDRSRDIIVERWLTEPKAKLKNLALHYKVSIERVSQLEKNAIKTLRHALEKAA